MSTGPRSRAEKAEETRNRVIDRARDLFVSQGFAATSTREIAAAAQVTERTLFNIVPSKGELLRQVLVTHVFAGDTGPILERADFAAVAGSGTATDFLDGFTAWVLSIHLRAAVLSEVVRAASSVDPGAAELWAWGTMQQVSDCRAVVELFSRRGWLRTAVPRTEAADSLAVVTGHETYWRLTTQLHWRPARYRRWMHRHCAVDLLGGSAGQG